MKKYGAVVVGLLGLALLTGCNSSTTSEDVTKINNEIKAKQDPNAAPIPPGQAAAGASMAAPGMFSKGKH